MNNSVAGEFFDVESFLRVARELDIARNDAETLLSECSEINRAAQRLNPSLLPENNPNITQQSIEQLRKSLARLAQGEPLAYVLGYAEFWSLTLDVSSQVLIPRADTECLVEWALELFPESNRIKVLDLGTGSGAIVAALATEKPEWQCLASDLSAGALDVAQSNVTRLGLDNIELIQSHWFDGLSRTAFELIVSNPPYIAEDDPHMIDLTAEPQSALTSGVDGLNDIREILEQAPDFLSQNGWLLIEHGYNQQESVQALLRQRGFESVATKKDYNGQPRVTGGKWCND